MGPISIWEHERIGGRQDYRMTGWQDGKMTEWEDERMTGLRDDRMAWWEDEKMAGWEGERVRGWQDDDRMTGWEDDRMAGWHDERVRGWEGAGKDSTDQADQMAISVRTTNALTVLCPTYTRSVVLLLMLCQSFNAVYAINGASLLPTVCMCRHRCGLDPHQERAWYHRQYELDWHELLPRRDGKVGWVMYAHVKICAWVI